MTEDKLGELNEKEAKKGHLGHLESKWRVK